MRRSGARSPVKSLSGGERNRLLLARLFTRPSNVLVLDEPTNDLDIETLELLEVLLQEYSGTLFLVSHDRAFLDNVVTQVIAFEGDGILREYVGGYDDWIRAKNFVKTAAKQEAAQPQPLASSAKVSKPTLRVKLSSNEMRELEALPAKIETLEQEQADITHRLGTPTIYRDNPEEARALQARFAAVEEELINCLARWDELEAKHAAAGEKK